MTVKKYHCTPNPIYSTFSLAVRPRLAQAARVLPDEAAAAIVVHPVTVFYNSSHAEVDAGLSVYDANSHNTAQVVAEAVAATPAAPTRHTDEMYSALEARNVRLMAQITALQNALDVKDNTIDMLQRQVAQLQQRR